MCPCADNKIGEEAGTVVGEALEVNKTLLHLDLGGTQRSRKEGGAVGGVLMRMGEGCAMRESL